jgi:hypothetical protein
MFRFIPIHQPTTTSAAPAGPDLEASRTNVENRLSWTELLRLTGRASSEPSPWMHTSLWGNLETVNS